MEQHVGAIEAELRLPGIDSLKAKRATIKPILEGAHRRYRVSGTEVSDADVWDRATLGFCANGSSYRHVEDVLDEVERFVWSFPEVEVVEVARAWMDRDA